MIRMYTIKILSVFYVGVELGFSQFGKNIITMFENRVLKKIYEPKRAELKGRRRKCLN